MAILTQGLSLVAAAIRGTGTDYDGTNARICVGDSATGFSAAHTDLQGTNHREVVDSAPSVSGAQTTYVATFETGDANFAWNEWGVANAAATTGLLNRVVESLGTKTSAQSWTFTVQLTFT